MLALAALSALMAASSSAWAAEDRSTDVKTAAAPARCGPGSRPETGLQGQVPLQDRLNGRSMQGYSCNMELVGQYAVGVISIQSYRWKSWSCSRASTRSG